MTVLELVSFGSSFPAFKFLLTSTFCKDASFKTEGLVGCLSPNVWFLALLDSTWHDGPGGTGVPRDIFVALFVCCSKCGSHMTRRVSSYHDCYLNSDLGESLWIEVDAFEDN